MADKSHNNIQLLIFSLVAAAFTNIYITQPVLPVLQAEFSTDMITVSFTVSAVILGIALSNLPFGALADYYPIHPIILVGGIMVAVAGLVCAVATEIWILISARFIQGFFIPALTTCLAAHLAKTLSMDRLNVVMASYVSATVLGGLGGRLLGGFIHQPVHWRYAFFSSSALVLVTAIIGFCLLPRNHHHSRVEKNKVRFSQLLMRRDILRIYFCAAGSFAVFSSIFNYLPFRLESPPFNLETHQITILYSVYVIGIFIGPLVGRLSDHFGSGATLIFGGFFLIVSIILSLTSLLVMMIFSLFCSVVFFFIIHAAAVGCLNRKLSSGQGRANALYVMFYYLGGWIGITVSGILFSTSGWFVVIMFCCLLLIIPLYTGYKELNTIHS